MANGVARGPGATIFASNDITGGVDRVRKGRMPELNWAPVFSANGMVSDSARKACSSTRPSPRRRSSASRSTTPAPLDLLRRRPLTDAAAGFDGLTRDGRRTTSMPPPTARGEVWRIDGPRAPACSRSSRPSRPGPSDVAFGRKGTSFKPAQPLRHDLRRTAARIGWRPRLSALRSTDRRRSVGQRSKLGAEMTVGLQSSDHLRVDRDRRDPGRRPAADRIAAPTGAGSACSAAAPCGLQTAVDGASAGDSVSLRPRHLRHRDNGRHRCPFTVRAAAGAEPLIRSSGAEGIVLDSPGARLRRRPPRDRRDHLPRLEDLRRPCRAGLRRRGRHRDRLRSRLADARRVRHPRQRLLEPWRCGRRGIAQLRRAGPIRNVDQRDRLRARDGSDLARPTTQAPFRGREQPRRRT